MIELDKPGAGIPGVERFVASRMIRTLAWLRSRDRLLAMMDREALMIVSICESLADEQARKEVLVDRFIGIEDSSRDWSVFMTLQHLCIVNAGIQSIIQSLTGGETFDDVVRIEDVKPDMNAGRESVEQFVESVKQFRQAMNQIESFKTGKTHLHPWFGEINAKQWFTLAAVHTQIHRKQIQKICDRM